MPISIYSRWDSAKVIATVENTDDLREAVIRLVNQGVDLYEANLTPIRNDFYAVLSETPAEVASLIEALAAGRVNGSTYSDGECGCLVGTLAIAAGANAKDADDCSAVHGLKGDSDRPIERFFMAIKKGDTPETNQFAKLAHGWAVEWLGRMQAAFGSKEVSPC
jgi:hypothetical protein